MRSNEVWSKLLVFSIIVDFRCQPYLKKDIQSLIVPVSDEKEQAMA